ncbi:MAG: monooxygenase [Micrococcales bacterium 73-13]|nr:MAG: monooxygenase [Micrococcales bacterium 73-13]
MTEHTASETDVPVLIAGGSLVGMTMAVLLGHRGIPTIVAERHRGTAIHPRAAFILQRSMEVLRSVGIEDAVMERSAEQFDQDAAIMAVVTMAGEEIAWYLPKLNDGVRDLSPSIRLLASQIAIEPLLEQRARELGADVRFGTEVVGFEQDGDGVTVRLRDRDGGAESSVRARYLIAADGAHSPIRERLGIGESGRGTFSKSVTIYFRADVEPLLRGRSLGVVMVVNDTLQGFFRIEKPYQSGFLAVHGLGDPAAPNSDVWTGLTEERCIELVRAGLGVPDIPVAIDDVMEWQASADVADRYQEGRVILVGDSAHVMPPYGGYGGNTGIQDAQNLAWKLAAVLRGEADPGLLATYEAERRPVGRFTVEQAFARYVARAAPSLRDDTIEPTVSDTNIDLGYRYRSSAIVEEPGQEFQVQGDPRESGGLPGTRAPHQEVRLDGRTISILDLFGLRPVLLAASEGGAWADAARAAAQRLGVPLDAYVVGADLAEDGGFAERYGLTASGAVLVRPDGVVAWRGRTEDPAAERIVADALGAVFGRSAPGA